MSNKIGVFIDLNNLYVSIDHQYNNRKLNYKSYLESIEEKFGVKPIIAKAYVTFGEDKNMRLYDAIRHVGYIVEYEESVHKDVEDQALQRALIQAETSMKLAAGIVQHAPKLDTIIIGSSDKNLLPFVRYVQHMGCLTNFYSTRISREIRLASDYWMEIEETLISMPGNVVRGKTDATTT